MAYFDTYLSKLKSAQKFDIVHVKADNTVMSPMYRAFTDWLANIARTSLCIPVVASTFALSSTAVASQSLVLDIAKQDPVLSIYTGNKKDEAVVGSIMGPSSHISVLSALANKTYYDIAPKGMIPHLMSASAAMNPNISKLVGAASDRIHANAYRDFMVVTGYGRHASKQEFSHFLAHFDRYTSINKATALAFRLAVEHVRSENFQNIDEKEINLAAIDAASGSTLFWLVDMGVSKKDAINITSFAQTMANDLVNDHDFSMTENKPSKPRV